MVKLHLACGPVYLKGWINIDAKGELVNKRSDLVKTNSTTIKNYFKNSYVRKAFGHNKRGKIVVDLKCNVLNLPFEDNSVDEILSVNLINHLKFQDFPKMIEEWNRVLRPGGTLITDVDDIMGHAKKLVKAKTKEEFEWVMRCIYCHARDKYDHHYWGFTPVYLKGLLKEYGFAHVWTKRDFIKHVYSSFQMCVKKT